MATITSAEAKQICSLERQEGCQALAKVLKLEEFDEENDPQTAILLEYYYGHLMFAVEKGFAWEQVAQTVKLADEILKETKGANLPEAILIYQKKCMAYKDVINEKNLTVLTDFYFSTFFAHYKLYQYVFSNKRETMTIQLSLPIDSPPEPLQMAKGKPAKIWEYENKLEEIVAAEQHHREEREKSKALEELERQKIIQDTEERIKDIGSPLDREKLVEIIKSVGKAHVSVVTSSLQHRMSDAVNSIGYMLQKTALPRPQELGAPPRYPQKIASATKRSKSPKEKGVKSRTSSGKSKAK